MFFVFSETKYNVLQNTFSPVRTKIEIIIFESLKQSPLSGGNIRARSRKTFLFKYHTPLNEALIRKCDCV